MNTNSNASDAAKLLAARSVNSRRKKWGKGEFRRRMQEWGKLGGRPKKAGSESRSKEIDT